MNDPVKILGYVILGVYALASFWLFLNALVQLHLLWHYKRKRNAAVSGFLNAQAEDFPFISIQVPVYNEKYVIDRLLEALANLDYPFDRYEIQILDDSTDETSILIDQKVKALSSRNLLVSVCRRGNRSGFKAGALQHGLPYCKGGLIAIFDADFAPPPHFLKGLIPYFSDPWVGLVQARWGHLNKEQNSLTRIQTFLLDTHFSVEQSGRYRAGYFINFCGTAGIWRKRCIEDAGGWDGGVLSEDLDLSYRAQLRGWKLIYEPEMEVPAEVPPVIEAFKIQQFRWTKGMAQISKKNLGRLLATSLPLDKKLHGAFHLLGSFVFVCLLVSALLTVPLLIYRDRYPEFIELTHYTLFGSINLVALTLFYYNGTRQMGNKGALVRFATYFPLFLVVYLGLSVQNAVAVLQGFWCPSSVFVRTPKCNARSDAGNHYLTKGLNWINALELLLLAYFLYGISLSIYLGDYFMMFFFMMMTYGLGFIIYQTLMLVQSRTYKHKGGRSC